MALPQWVAIRLKATNLSEQCDNLVSLFQCSDLCLEVNIPSPMSLGF